MARYSLFVLKVLLNPKQASKQTNKHLHRVTFRDPSWPGVISGKLLFKQKPKVVVVIMVVVVEVICLCMFIYWIIILSLLMSTVVTSARFEKDQYDKVPFFMFGDYNFRLDTNQLVKVCFRSVVWCLIWISYIQHVPICLVTADLFCLVPHLGNDL